VLALISLLAVFQARRRPYLLVGWLWYLGTLVPVIGIIQVGNQALADRFTYLPSIGLSFIVAWGLVELIEIRPRLRSVGPWPVGVALGTLAVCSWTQAGYWRDNRTLWVHTIEVTTDNPVAHNNLGVALWMDHEPDQALMHFAEAYRLQPHYGNAKHNLEVAHYELGTSQRQKGKWEAAQQHFLQATLLNPGNASAFNQRGIVLGFLAQWPEAVECFKQAVNLEPRRSQYRADLALAFDEIGEKEAAQLQYREATRGDPAWPEQARKTAWMLATRPEATHRDGGRALQLARQVCQAASQLQPEDLDALAAAWAESGLYPEAIKYAQAALELATSSCFENSGIRQHLISYQKHLPWRETENHEPCEP
jgi:protein O-mannosyl-transferase